MSGTNNDQERTINRRTIIYAFSGNCLIILLVFILGVKVGKEFFANPGLPSDEEIINSTKAKEVDVTFPRTLLSRRERYVDKVEIPRNLPVIKTSIPRAKKPGTKKVKTSTKATKAKTKKKYTVQTGSFIRAKDAKKMVKRLKGGNLDAYIVKVRLKNKKVRYRVRVGQYQSKNEGYRAIRVISKKYNIKPLLIER